METVLSRIMNGVYKPGDKLPAENSLAEEFGVSRITIREAFKKLNMLNVVSIRQGDGTFVEKVDRGLAFQPMFSTLLFEHDSIEQLYDARKWLEMGGIAMACEKVTPADIRELDGIIARMDEALEAGDAIAYCGLDDELHIRIFKIADNFAMHSVYVVFRDIVKLYRKKSLLTKQHMRVSHKRHHAMIEAMSDGDASAAVELMRRHIEVCKDQLIERIEKARSEEAAATGNII